MSHLRESGAQAAFTLGCEWFPFVHQAMGLNLHTMEEHTNVFHDGSYARPESQNASAARGDEPWPPPEALQPSVFVVMKAWDYDQQETQALKFARVRVIQLHTIAFVCADPCTRPHAWRVQRFCFCRRR